MSHISVSTQFTLKNPDKGYIGMRSKSWNFCRDQGQPFSQLAFGIIRKLAEFWWNATDVSTEEANAEIRKLAELIAGMECQESER